MSLLQTLANAKANQRLIKSSYTPPSKATSTSVGIVETSRKINESVGVPLTSLTPKEIPSAVMPSTGITNPISAIIQRTANSPHRNSSPTPTDSSSTSTLDVNSMLMGGVSTSPLDQTLPDGSPIIEPESSVITGSSEVMGQLDKMLDLIEGVTTEDTTNTTSPKEIDLAKQISSLEEFGHVGGFTIGYDADGNPFLQGISVDRPEQTDSTYKIYGYDSGAQYAYNALTGHVRGTVGGKRTIFDYAQGIGQKELTAQPWVNPYQDNYYDYQGYERLGTAGSVYYDNESYGYDDGYTLPYRYRRMIQWVL